MRHLFHGTVHVPQTSLWAHMGIITYCALQMKLPTDFCENVFGFVWPRAISGGSQVDDGNPSSVVDIKGNHSLEAPLARYTLPANLSWAHTRTITYCALQMKLPIDFISSGSLPKLALFQTSSSAPFLRDIPVYSSNEFLRENFAMEFTSGVWDVELDSGKPKLAARSHQICPHVGWQFHLQGTVRGG